MTKEAKQEVLKVLRECTLAISEDVSYTRHQLIAAVEAMPEEEKALCSAPNYEVMYHEAEEKLKRQDRELECQEEMVRDLRNKCARLEGFKEAVLRMFPEQGYGHGLH